jgi:hypothetical protein
VPYHALDCSFDETPNPTTNVEVEMKRPVLLAAFAVMAGMAAVPVAFVAPAQAQYRGYGDRDHDGVPNRYDRHNDNGALGDRDHDGVPNAFDHRNDNRAMGDRDHDGVPNRFDSSPNNPYRR